MKRNILTNEGVEVTNVLLLHTTMFVVLLSETYLINNETNERLSELPSLADKPEAVGCYWCVVIPTHIQSIPASYGRLCVALIGQCHSAARGIC